MKNYCYLALLSVCLLLFTQATQAQFLKKIKDHAADVVNNKIDDVVNGSGAEGTAETADNQRSKAVAIAVPFDFKAGDSILFQDDFSRDQPGHFPKRWKTNASGSVAKVPGVSGQWFLLNNNATYKLDTLLSMPKDFTVEFDILASCNKAADLSSLDFGFTRDNNAGEYIGGVGVAGVELNYMNDDEYYTASRDLDNYHFGNFNLVNTLNAPLHVSIQVNGVHMKVYLGKTRILDADMFQPGTRKYFFISSPLYYKNGAKVLIGNVNIAAQN